MRRLPTPELDLFAQTAEQFCALIETAHRYELAERVVRCAAAVAQLYAAGLYLPLADEPPERDEPPAPPDVPSWPAFEELTMFWQVPDAYARSAPEVVSLNDALLGIYRDVKRGLLILDRGYDDAAQEAAWYWRENMERYWGNYAADALRALNRAAQKLGQGDRDF